MYNECLKIDLNLKKIINILCMFDGYINIFLNFKKSSKYLIYV